MTRPSTPRRVKTPAERAQEQLDVANRAVIRLDRKVDAARTELAQLELEHADAVRRQQYLRQHPDLPQQQETTTTTTEKD